MAPIWYVQWTWMWHHKKPLVPPHFSIGMGEISFCMMSSTWKIYAKNGDGATLNLRYCSISILLHVLNVMCEELGIKMQKFKIIKNELNVRFLFPILKFHRKSIFKLFCHLTHFLAVESSSKHYCLFQDSLFSFFFLAIWS